MKAIEGTGRVSVFPLLHSWPDGWAVCAYTSSGHFGDTAITGYLPMPDIPDAPLLDVAARHQGGTTGAHVNWVLCTAWSSRTVPKPGTLDLRDAAWRLEPENSGHAVEPKRYGHGYLHTGRFSLVDPELQARAIGVLRSRVLGQGHLVIIFFGRAHAPTVPSGLGCLTVLAHVVAGGRPLVLRAEGRVRSEVPDPAVDRTRRVLGCETNQSSPRRCSRRVRGLS